MKRILLLLMLFGCEESNNVQTINSKKVTNIYMDGISNTDIYEFEYKGHTYIGCNVHGGKSLTHAGHCRCNKK